jgi:ABC-2 type transport system ATP-binding protein
MHDIGANDSPAISIRGLSKIYPGQGRRPAVTALDGVDLEISRGSFFGLLGPNGAGKSTLINILGGLTIKTRGQVAISGFDIDAEPRSARAAIGIVPQEINADYFFKARELLEFQAGLYGVAKADRRSDELLKAMHLQDQAWASPRALSGGMRRRLMVAKAMVHSPPILVLDEPTAGVDVELRQELWAYIRGLNRSGVTVLLTTHYLEEAQALCDSIAIVNRGKIIACDKTPELLARLDRKHLSLVLKDDLEVVPEGLRRFRPELKDVRRLVFAYRPSEVQTTEILSAVQAAGLDIVDLTTEESDLEDLFLELTRKQA